MIAPLLAVALLAADAAPPAFVLSQALAERFRDEMQVLLGGSQAIAVALPAGDWPAVAAAAGRMRDSYVLEAQLTEAQEAEVRALPAAFRELDETFHARAGELARAAERRDLEGAATAYARVLATCGACHAQFAAQRCPGFAGGGSPQSRSGERGIAPAQRDARGRVAASATRIRP